MSAATNGALAVSAVDVYGYELSYRHGEYVMSGNRSIAKLASTVVRVTTRSGLVGFGEVCPLGSTYLPAHASGARAALAEMIPHLLGLEVSRLAVIAERLDQALRGHLYAKSAVDIACWDIVGQAASLPLCDLLGGRRQERFPLYVAVPLGSPGEMREHVQMLQEAGVHAFQLKLGGDPELDADRAAAVVEATREGETVIADANGGWSLREAAVAARLLERLPRVYLEQPCLTLDECVQVRRRTSLPMMLDESIGDLAALMRARAAQAMEGFNLKIGRVGGLSKARLLRDVAEDLGLALTIEDTWGGDIATAAVSHLAASTSAQSLFTVSFMNDWTVEHIAGYEPRSSKGFGAAPRRPGLGIDVDLERLGEPLFSVGAASPRPD